ncbi:MAG TPA: hypothetical protein VL992_16305 [Tepidisphaeraceae bacterium]|nr:hypothetical protein [Tepidisphaeraceae bacterium]
MTLLTNASRGIFATLALLGVLAFASMPAFAQRVHHRSSAVLDAIQPELKFENVPLSDALDFIRDTSQANVIVDWKALESVNVDRDSLINLHLRNVTLRKALNIILDEAAPGDVLTFYMDDNVIEVTTQEKADSIMFTMVYPVQDLLVQIPQFTQQDLSGLVSAVSSSSGQSTTLGGGQTATNLSSGGGAGSALGQGTSNSQNIKTQADAGADLVKLITDTVRPEVWRQNGGNCSISFYNGLLIVTAPRSVQEAIGGPID